MVQKRPVDGTPIFHKAYGLYKLMVRFSPQVPKMQRYTLWQQCERRALAVLEGVIEAGSSLESERLASLRHLSQDVDVLKVLIRLSKESRVVDAKSYLSLQGLLQEIGRMLGGWMKHCSSEGKANNTGNTEKSAAGDQAESASPRASPGERG